MRMFVFFLVAAIGFCNPNPDPKPTPTPTPTPPGHVCVVDKEFCNCYVMPPETGEWILVSCPAGQECTTEYQCITPEPTCPELCPPNTHCTDPLKGCVPDEPTPPPSTTSCPKEFEGSHIGMSDKSYGQGQDSTVWVYGDPQFCFLIHGVAVNGCHLEGWPKRAQCEMELLGGCPIWQYTPDAGKTVYPCYNDESALASCDHFGDPVFRDDPKTPQFEGRPEECGLQRNMYGPYAGFFTIAHGGPSGCKSGVGPFWQVRACRPDGQGCGPWLNFCK